MKLSRIIFLGLAIMLAMIAVSVALPNRISNTQSFSDCKKNCVSELRVEKADCRSNFTDGMSLCREDFNICKEAAGKNRTMQKACKVDYNTCKADSREEKSLCHLAANSGFSGCKSGCGVCIDLYEPVCGSDNKTYSNSCFMAIAGVEKSCDGGCPCRRVCMEDKDCKHHEFCESSVCPGTPTYAESMGECVTVPDNCIALNAPVCGCDGNTYSNNCERRRAEVSYAYFGACQPDSDE